MLGSQPSANGVGMHSLRFAFVPSNQLTRNTQPGIPLRAPFRIEAPNVRQSVGRALTNSRRHVGSRKVCVASLRRAR